MTAAFIARSALAFFLLEIARLDEPDLAGLTLEFTPTSATRCNWRVAAIDFGGADPERAQAAVAAAVRGNGAWTMVEDGDPRDGQPDRRECAAHTA